MNHKLTYIALALYAAGYAMLFGTWAGIVFCRDPFTRADQLISYIQVTLGALTGHILTMLTPRPTRAGVAPSTSAEAGFVRPEILVALALAMLALAGCAGLQQAVNGYEASGLVAAQAANDNAVRLWSTAACATPISAAVRNPQVVPAIKVLCFPASGDKTSTLLDAVPAAATEAK